MKTELYQYGSTRTFSYTKLPGYFHYRLCPFYSLGDFVFFEYDMERCASTTMLEMVINTDKMLGTIYDPQTEVLTPMPIDYFVGNNGREFITIMLLNKYPVAIEFNDSWFRMFHFDDDTYDVESLATDFLDKKNNDVQSSLQSTVAEFNISLATSFALYPEVYSFASKNGAIYY